MNSCSCIPVLASVGSVWCIQMELRSLDDWRGYYKDFSISSRVGELILVSLRAASMAVLHSRSRRYSSSAADGSSSALSSSTTSASLESAIGLGPSDSSIGSQVGGGCVPVHNPHECRQDALPGFQHVWLRVRSHPWTALPLRLTWRRGKRRSAC